MSDLKKLKKKAKKAGKKGGEKSIASLQKQLLLVGGSLPSTRSNSGSPITGLAQAARAAKPSINACREMTAYLHALVNPEDAIGSKVPDLYSYPTATYHSVTTVMLRGNSATASLASDKGRFCVVVKPVLVATDATTTYDARQLNSFIRYKTETSTWSNGFSTIAGETIVFDDNANIMCPRITVRDGLAERARCVGCSAWMEYEGSTLEDQGSIAAALVPGDAWGHHMSAASGVNYTRWEQLATAPGAYQGKAKTGAYVYWRPQGYRDVDFYETDATNLDPMQVNSYPFMVLSGILPAGINQGTSVLRLRVVTNYEIITSSLVLVSQPSPVCLMQLELAARVLAGQPMAMPNEDHQSWLSRLFKVALGAAAGFVLGGGLPGAAVGALSGAGIPNPFLRG